MIDIDHFKQINDTYGHLTGDSVLRNLASILQKRLRPNDKLGRYGGEEFCAILPETNLTNAVRTAEELRTLVAAHSFVAEGKELRITMSLGAATLNGVMQAEQLYKAADDLLYQAKRTGRRVGPFLTMRTATIGPCRRPTGFAIPPALAPAANCPPRRRDSCSCRRQRS